MVILVTLKKFIFLGEWALYEISYNSCKNSFMFSLMIEMHLLDTDYDTYY